MEMTSNNSRGRIQPQLSTSHTSGPWDCHAKLTIRHLTGNTEACLMLSHNNKLMLGLKKLPIDKNCIQWRQKNGMSSFPNQNEAGDASEFLRNCNLGGKKWNQHSVQEVSKFEKYIYSCLRDLRLSQTILRWHLDRESAWFQNPS